MYFGFFLQAILYYFIGINIFAIIVMGYDKIKARLKRYRISERFLIDIALIGGSFGILIAMLLFRHKIRTKKFYIGIPLIIFGQLTLFYYAANFLDRVNK